MARIRTIKPEFFTSADIVALSPLARLLFIGLWGIADREGRMKWRPADFKLQILPGDECEIAPLCAELIDGGLVVLYGDGLAYIPTFTEHQSINPRETPSRLPPPDAPVTRAHASNPDAHEQRGREGKGRNNDPTDRADKPPAVDENPPDAAAVIFGNGLAWLKRNSAKNETECRALLGKWRKSLGDEGLIAALGRAQREGALQPVAWMEAAIKAHKATGPPASTGWN